MIDHVRCDLQDELRKQKIRCFNTITGPSGGQIIAESVNHFVEKKLRRWRAGFEWGEGGVYTVTQQNTHAYS